MLEIRWHGRGGQGTKTVALLLAETVIENGQFGQGFPEYGPERMGAPVRGYNRVDDRPIRLHCGIKRPNVVIVLDPSLLEAERVVEGLTENGILLVNTARSPADLRRGLNLSPTQAVYTVDASQIARETIGRDIPNMVMMGVLVRMTGIMSLDRLEKNIQKKFHRKLATRVIEGNLQAIHRAYEEVQTDGSTHH